MMQEFLRPTIGLFASPIWRTYCWRHCKRPKQTLHEMMMASQHRQVFVQDMSEVLMLDMGGNGGYGQGSPGEAARFSFSEHSSHTMPADTSDAAWQIAEVSLQKRALAMNMELLLAHVQPPFFLSRGLHCIVLPFSIACYMHLLRSSWWYASSSECLLLHYCSACTDISAFCEGLLKHRQPCGLSRCQTGV